MSKTKTMPTKKTVRKLVSLALLLITVVWVVQHPYQVRDWLDQLAHALTVMTSGWGR